MVVCHADDDHIKGLISMIKHDLIHVKKVIHNRTAKFKSGFDTSTGDINDQLQRWLHRMLLSQFHLIYPRLA